MNKVKFILVKNDNQVDQVEELADRIWNEHYAGILDREQIKYMVSKFQSKEAIIEQITKNQYQYYLLCVDDNYVGFTGIKEEPEENRLFLSKLYIEKAYRGYGYGSETFAFLETLGQKKGYNKIWLTVNRYNENSIKTYEKKGYQKAYTQVSDIGEGYVMDDYVMEKIL